MEIDPTGMDRQSVYKLLTGSVVPRPIAWVSTISETGCINAAPFSAFAIVSVVPPMVLISCAQPEGVKNDTARNIEATHCFVVNIVTEKLLDLMHATSARYPSDVSETTALDIATHPSSAIVAPRILESPISLECKLKHTMEFGDQKSQSFVGEVVRLHIRESVYLNGGIDQERLRPVGRIGGPVYARLGEFVRLAAAKPVRS